IARRLPTEMESTLSPPPQVNPKLDLLPGHAFAQIARDLVGHSPNPPRFARHPSPFGGGMEHPARSESLPPAFAGCEAAPHGQASPPQRPSNLNTTHPRFPGISPVNPAILPATRRRKRRGASGRIAMTDDTLPRRRFLVGASTAVAAGLAASGSAPAQVQTAAAPAAAPAAAAPAAPAAGASEPEALLTLTAAEHAFVVAAVDTF